MRTSRPLTTSVNRGASTATQTSGSASPGGRLGLSAASESIPLYVKISAFQPSNTRWNRITLLVRLNDPPNIANGNIQL